VLDPLGRLLRTDVVSDGDLVVDGVTVRGEDPRAVAVRDALALPTAADRAAALRAEGIRWVVVEKDAGASPVVAGEVVHDGPLLRVLRLAGAVRASPPGAGTVVAQVVAWTGFAGLVAIGLVGCAMSGMRRMRVRMDTPRLPTGSVRD
jgi:hypothetical protein